MQESSDTSEVSFLELAEQYEMSKGRRGRWRDQRDTLPARRRRRRAHRRDRNSSRDYHPMKVDSRSANRGIQSRLLGAMLSAMITVVCLLSIVLAPEITLGSTFAITVGIASLGLSMALTMSARREEIVHQVAGRLNQEIKQSKQRALPPADEPRWAMEDGDVETMASIEKIDDEPATISF